MIGILSSTAVSDAEGIRITPSTWPNFNDMRALIWFRNDLRIHDHEGLHKASTDHREHIGLYCFGPAQFGETTSGLPKTGAFRAHFTIESVIQLRYNLQTLGGDLIVRQQDPAEVIAQIHKESPLDVIYFESENTFEEQQEEEAVRALGIPMESYWGKTLVHPEDVAKGIERLPNGFTSWRKRQEAHWAIRDEFPRPHQLFFPETLAIGPIPTLDGLGIEAPESDARGVLSFKGGESEALVRLQHYFWDANELRRYKETRNGLLGPDYSSKFSPWLANGSLSPRRVYFEILRYEEQVEKNESTYWMIFELLWRDFFRFKSMKLGAGFFKHPVQGRIKNPWGLSEFRAWVAGETGVPFVDANMRELAATGFMSNRGRQNVASYLINDLRVDWTLGAEWFESLLIDYDVASNYGNWTYLAGNGADPRGKRYFNIPKQASMYDPDGSFQAHWLED